MNIRSPLDQATADAFEALIEAAEHDPAAFRAAQDLVSAITPTRP